MQQLADWATEEQHQQSTVGLSRLQQVAQLPLNSEEEAALLGWCRQRFAAGQPGAHMLPLYLLQVRFTMSTGLGFWVQYI